MNARYELYKMLTEANSSIKCAFIKDVRSYDEEEQKTFNLKIGYTKDEMTKFFECLDYEYDSGYGGQELEGIVWLVDGTWLDRGEYDGSEWWNHQKCPEIPKELLI